MLEQSQEATKKIMDKGLIDYSDSLDRAYNEKEKEYNELLQKLYDSYGAHQDLLINNLNSTKAHYLAEINEIETILNKLRATRAAAIEASIKE